MFHLNIFVYKLLHDLPNDFKLTIMGNKEMLEESQNSRNETLPIAVKNDAKTNIKVF